MPLTALPEYVADQIAAVSFDPDRPLVITDADEVIVHFVQPLEAFLESKGLYLDVSSFRLSGNVRERATDEVLEHEKVMALIDAFFAEKVATCPPVEGASDALEALSERASILVLTNVPRHAREARITALKGHGMGYPLIAGEGPKGPAIKALTEGRRAPTVFLDDIPHNHASTAEEAADVHRIHFIADPRLARLLEPAEGAHARIDNWPDVHTYVDELFGSAGF